MSYSPWGHKESDTTELLILSLSDALRRGGGLHSSWVCRAEGQDCCPFI